MGQAKDPNEIVVRKSERKELPERLKDRWKEIFKTEFKAAQKECVDCFQLA
jgi:hypothetical protein